ncbi:MAG: hypothetical protein AAF725_03940 [Acidobacteriota bacterium]
MSSDLCFFAEEQLETGWHVLGSLRPTPYEGPPQPQYRFDISPRNELMTVLRGDVFALAPFQHSGLEVLSKPRGLPENLSRELRLWADSCGDSLIVPSWLLAREILEVDWESPSLLMIGYAFPAKARLFEPLGSFPEQSWPEARNRVSHHPDYGPEDQAEAPEQVLYTWRPPGAEEIYWTESPREYLGESLEEFLDELRRLGPPDRVRIVFWTEH